MVLVCWHSLHSRFPSILSMNEIQFKYHACWNGTPAMLYYFIPVKQFYFIRYFHLEADIYALWTKHIFVWAKRGEIATILQYKHIKIDDAIFILLFYSNEIEFLVSINWHFFFLYNLFLFAVTLNRLLLNIIETCTKIHNLW